MNASRQNPSCRANQRPPALALVVLLLWPGLVTIGGCGGSAADGPSAGSSPPQVDLWPSAQTTGGQTPVREGCDLLAGEGDPNGSFVFALNEEVLPGRAPVPHNRSERIVFAHLYETLVTVDCAGNLQPALAEHWTCTEDSMVWVFTLREEARFWDGSRLTAGEVRLSWARSQDAMRASGCTSPWAWLNAREQTVQVIDARHLAVRLPEPQARFPMLLAHPATAVAARRDGWTWPVGSGSARLRASDPAPRPDLHCRPNPSHPRPPLWKNLVFRVEPGADPRDLVATDMDLTVVRDLRTVSFFGDAPGFQPQPLPWDLLYILVCPPEANPGGAARWVDAVAGLDMTRDVTRVASREWTEIVFPGGGGSDCPQLSGPIADGGSARLDWNLAALDLDNNTLIYPDGDPGAARNRPSSERPVRRARPDGRPVRRRGGLHPAVADGRRLHRAGPAVLSHRLSPAGQSPRPGRLVAGSRSRQA